MKSINPFTNKLIKEYPGHNPQESENIIIKVDSAFMEWKNTGSGIRKKMMCALADELEKRKDEFANLIVSEMGKIKKEALAEIFKCAGVCRYYAEKAENFLSPEKITTESSNSMVHFKPLGTVLAIMPWNFPFWQVFRFLVPTLMAGNTAILKHASNVSGCALAIENLVKEAGFPQNVFRVVLVSGKETDLLIKNPGIKAVSLTGSSSSGKAVASLSGQMLKKTVLELGGNDPYLILQDANIKEAAKLCVDGRLLNAGQSCIGAKRFIVLEEVYEDFKEEFVKLMKTAVYGDPLSSGTSIGPLARLDLRDELHQQVVRSVKQGAKVICGGYIPEGESAFYPPTVLENVKLGMPAYHEELFGPVASLFKVKSVEEGINISNDTNYGLGAGIFTNKIEFGKELAENHLEAGNVFVNDFVKSDPQLPFGGINESGYGRELSIYGIREFVNIKTIVVKTI